jgi:hypothetical protein
MYFPDRIPRSLLALTGIVAIVAVALGIKDYVAQAPASMSTPTLVDSNPTGKRAPTKTARKPETKANARATSQAFAEDMEKPLIRQESTKAGVKVAIDNTQKIDGPTSSDPQCLPLPNGTKLGNTDAAYYRNWAREYGCYDSIQSAASGKLR